MSGCECNDGDQRTSTARAFWHASGEAALIVDRTGAIEDANGAAVALLAPGDGELVGHDLAVFVGHAPQQDGASAPTMERLLQGEGSAECRVWIESRRGREVAARMRVVSDADGVAGGDGKVLVILQPEARGRRQSAALKHARAELDHVIHGTAEAVVSTDDRRRIVRFNGAAEEMFGYSAEEVLGQELEMLIPDDVRTRHRAHVEEFMRLSSSARWMNERDEVAGRRKDGSVFPAEATILKTKAFGRVTYTAVLRDVTERKNVETRLRDHVKELALARRDAEAANRAKSEFLATMSHELRTPLNAVIGFAQTMTDELFGPLGNPRYQDYAGDILESAQHLLEILNDILDVSRAEAGRVELREELVGFDEIARGCMRLMAEKARLGGLTLTNDLPDDAPVLVVDVRLMKQVLINLLSNAVKFTPRGGRVNLGVKREADGGLRISVADTGVGVDPKDRERVFEPFTQTDAVRTRAHEGTGLGLSLVRSLVELHGGRAWLDSVLGEGTTVHVSLPAHRVIEPDETPALLRRNCAAAGR